MDFRLDPLLDGIHLESVLYRYKKIVGKKLQRRIGRTSPSSFSKNIPISRGVFFIVLIKLVLQQRRLEQEPGKYLQSQPKVKLR